MIAAGTTITFTAKGTTGQWLPRTVAGVRQDVIDGLTPFFDVLTVVFDTKDSIVPFYNVANWGYTATIRATVRADYGDVRDVDSIVAHAFYDAAGDLPTVSAAGYEQAQGEEDQRTGFSLTTALVLGVVAIVAIAVIKVAD